MIQPTAAFEVRHLFLLGVGWTVIGQLYVIGFITMLTFALLLLRGWRRGAFDKLDKIYGEVIMNELLEHQPGEIPLVKSHTPKWYQWFRRRSLKKILLNNIRSIAGHEKALLVQTYCVMGYANSDRDRSYSMFWWRRLEGISSLSGLDIHDSAVIFDELRKDKEELVSMAATLALSGVRHSLNGPEILKDLSVRALRRRNLLLQIANNWALVYGPGFLLDCLRRERRDELIKVYIAALAELNSPEVGGALTDWLMADDRRREPQTLVYIIRTLKSIGDPSSIDVVENFLLHADEHVRAEAMDLIVRLGSPEDYMPIVDRLVFDSSVSVQRVLRQVQELQEKRVAA